MHVIVSVLSGMVALASPSTCEQWSDDLIVRLSSPVTDTRLMACREARSRPECGAVNGPAVLSRPASISPSAISAPRNNNKVQLRDVSASPDPFSPVVDTFLDVTVLRGTARFHHTDAHGSSSSFDYVLALDWVIRDASQTPVQRIHHELALEADVAPGRFSDVGFDLVWNGMSIIGSLAPDGEYFWSLDAQYLRIGSLSHPTTKVVGQDSTTGTVRIDGAVGEGMRASLEEALIARIPDSSISVRRAAIASLALIGREQSVSALYAAMLDDDLHDPLTRGLAACSVPPKTRHDRWRKSGRDGGMSLQHYAAI